MIDAKAASQTEAVPSATGAPVPKLFAIPAGRPFLDSLAAGLMARHGSGDDLGHVTVLLPTRRACRALVDAFLRQTGGRPMLLPNIRPIGDVDEEDLLLQGVIDDEAARPVIDPLRRQLLLARLVLAGGFAGNEPAMAVALAQSLAELIDSAALEGIGLDGLDALVGADYAAHWQKVLAFLAIARTAWPDILAAENAIDAATHRVMLITMLANAWRTSPPAHPVYAAGSTGTVPATADLLRVVSRLPHGGLIVEGLDVGATDEDWRLVLDDPVHPQHTLARLLSRLGLDRREAQPWLAADGVLGTPRFALLSAALRPAAMAEGLVLEPAAWQDGAFHGMRRFLCASPREEALAIALELRGALETPGRTAALVTPDRQLARRVAAELGRWGVAVDDSGGVPLSRTPPGALLHLVADMLGQDFAPVSLLSVLKHPLSRCGRAREGLLETVRLLDRTALRGLRPLPGIAGLRAAVERHDGLEAGGREAVLALFHDLEAAAQPLLAALDAEPVEFTRLVEDLARFSAWVASESSGEVSELWQREAGEALAQFIDDLRQGSRGLADFGLGGGARQRLAPMVHALMQGRVVRPRRANHPRISIWGQLEARLLHADLVVLGGLNEGTWPPEAVDDPWLNRRMKETLGLPSPERRIGQTAHDFLMAATANEVVLSRSARVEGAETVSSRWLMRLDAALAHDKRWAATIDRATPEIASAIDRRDTPLPVIGPPRPRPPVAARPRRLSVTQVETLIRDPYAIYARHVLRLPVLDDIDAEAGAAERGTIIHRAMEQFINAHRETLPVDALAQLVRAGEQAFGPLLHQPAVRTFWWPRFLRAASWFLEREIERRAGGVRPLVAECKGELRLDVPGYGTFTLSGTADRIDLLPGGALSILDYKTGKPPTGAQIKSGLAPQLPLEAAMAVQGAFPGINASKVGELVHVHLSGRGDGGSWEEVQGPRRTPLDPMNLAQEALARLTHMIERFADQSMAYPSRLRPRMKNQAGDYDHLARVGEWPPEFAGDE